MGEHDFLLVTGVLPNLSLIAPPLNENDPPSPPVTLLNGKWRIASVGLAYLHKYPLEVFKEIGVQSGDSVIMGVSDGVIPCPIDGRLSWFTNPKRSEFKLHGYNTFITKSNAGMSGSKQFLSWKLKKDQNVEDYLGSLAIEINKQLKNVPNIPNSSTKDLNGWGMIAAMIIFSVLINLFLNLVLQRYSDDAFRFMRDEYSIMNTETAKKADLTRLQETLNIMKGESDVLRSNLDQYKKSMKEESDNLGARISELESINHKLEEKINRILENHPRPDEIIVDPESTWIWNRFWSAFQLWSK